MKFIKLIRFDMHNGFSKVWKKLLAVSVLTLLLCLYFTLCLNSFHRGQTIANEKFQPSSFADAVFFIFGGMEKYVPQPDAPFIFPVAWILLCISLLRMTLEYAYNDLQTYGQQLLIRTGTRTAWWLSKCLWNIVCVVGFFIFMWIVIFLYCAVTQIPLNMTLHADILTNTLNTAAISGPAISYKMLLSVFLVTPLILLALSLLQMTLTLFVQPIYSFCMITAVLVVSAYWQSPLLPGNYAMPVRSSQYTSDGVSLTVGLLYAGAMIVGTILIGLVRFRHYDILQKE